MIPGISPIVQSFSSTERGPIPSASPDIKARAGSAKEPEISKMLATDVDAAILLGMLGRPEPPFDPVFGEHP